MHLFRTGLVSLWDTSSGEPRSDCLSGNVILQMSDAPLLSAPFGLEDRWLLWSKLRLYPDRLELRGWTFTGRFRRHIRLERVTRTDHEDGHLLLYLQRGERIRLVVEEARRWAEFVSSQREIQRDD